jgi:hypothetical protein
VELLAPSSHAGGSGFESSPAPGAASFIAATSSNSLDATRGGNNEAEASIHASYASLDSQGFIVVMSGSHVIGSRSREV